MGQAIYTAVATARGDGRNGEVTSSDGVIDESLAIPKEMGGPGGDKTNPEQLFAAGYSACFHSALQLVARQAKVPLNGSTVTAEVSVLKQEVGFGLGVALNVSLPADRTPIRVVFSTFIAAATDAARSVNDSQAASSTSPTARPAGVSRVSALSWRSSTRCSAREVIMRYGSSTPLLTKSSISTPM